MTNQPVAETAEGTIVPAEENLPEFRMLYDPELDFRKLALEAAYHARGFRRVVKDWLVAVPFVCISAIYREGYLKDGVQGDYLTLEAVVGDNDFLNMPQVRQAYAEAHEGSIELFVYPNEPVVLNDGGTGIRRTITKLLDDLGMIDVGGKESDGARRYDRPFSLWKAGADEAQTGFVSFPNGKPFGYLATRGLRRSDYESPFGPATTYYFA